jgi:hypothetical protein
MQACHYALDEKVWAHAMVTVSSIDRDTWLEVAKEFIRAELGSMEVKDDKPRPNDPRLGPLFTPTSNGRENLRVACSLFAGQDAGSGMFTLTPRVAAIVNSCFLPLRFLESLATSSHHPRQPPLVSRPCPPTPQVMCLRTSPWRFWQGGLRLLR